MKISSTLGRGLMITAALSILALMGWKALHYERAVKQANAPEVVRQRQVPEDDATEAKRKKEIVNQWLAESKRKLQETTQTLEKLKQQRKELQAELSKQQVEGGIRRVTLPLDASIELSPLEKARTTWTGHTDPDRVWHEQQKKARETLIQFNLPASAGQR